MPIALAPSGAIHAEWSEQGMIAALSSYCFVQPFRMISRAQALLQAERSEMQMIEIIEGRGIAKEMSVFGWY
jgi:hypothetical protein